MPEERQGVAVIQPSSAAPKGKPVFFHGNALFFVACCLTNAMLCSIFAVTLHKPMLWCMAVTMLLLVNARISEARNHPRKEIEALNL